MRVLDLCSGIGGFALAHEMVGGFETVAFCEQDAFCQRVLQKHWPNVPIFDDIRTLKGDDIGTADVICGGIPCQPFSFAGQRRGADDERHLWPHFLRLLRELRPTWCIVENVSGFISMAVDGVLFDLESEGYAGRPFVISACGVNAPHRRDRVWVVAYAEPAERRPFAQGRHEHEQADAGWQETASGPELGGKGGTVGHANAGRKPQPEGLEREKRGWVGDAGAVVNANEPGRWSGQFMRPGGDPWADSEWLECADSKARRVPASSVRGMDDGISAGMDGCVAAIPLIGQRVPERAARLRALGNAIVPQVAARIFYAIRQSA